MKIQPITAAAAAAPVRFADRVKAEYSRIFGQGRASDYIAPPGALINVLKKLGKGEVLAVEVDGEETGALVHWGEVLWIRIYTPSDGLILTGYCTESGRIQWHEVKKKGNI